MKLSDKEIEEELTGLEGWVVKDNFLIKEFEFKDFKEAMDFMNRLALTAEELNHHPDWSNSYNKVLIKLTTHSEKGLTEKDFKLAEAANKSATNP